MGANGSTLSIDLVNGSMHHSSRRHGGGYGGHSRASCTKSRTVPQGRHFIFGFFFGAGGGVWGEESSPFMATCSIIL